GRSRTAARPRTARPRLRLRPAPRPGPRRPEDFMTMQGWFAGLGGLRVARHRATTAQLGSAWPFLAEGGVWSNGAYLGIGRPRRWRRLRLRSLRGVRPGP